MVVIVAPAAALIGREHEHGSAVHMHRARPALPDPQPLRSREIERVTKNPEKRHLRFDIDDGKQKPR